MSYKKRSIQSACRFLYLIKSLNEKYLSIEDMIYEVEKEFDYSLELDSVHEYLASMRKLGLKIKKKGYRPVTYHLQKSPILFNLDYKDRWIISKINQILKSSTTLNMTNQWQNLKYSLQRYICEDITSNYCEFNIDDKIKKFENYCADNLRLDFNNNIYEPLCVEYRKSEPVLKAINIKNGGVEKIKIIDIKTCKQLPIKNRLTETKKHVLFKVKGDFIHRYEPYPNDLILERHPEYILVETKDYSYDEILDRLIKYGECCEIIEPQSLIEKELMIINEMLVNYKIN